MGDNEMTIVEWFEPTNIEHIKAYKHLMDTGMWDKGFIPEDVEMTSQWNLMLMGKIVDHYVDEMLDGSQ